jgi:hypothetical protein
MGQAMEGRWGDDDWQGEPLAEDGRLEPSRANVDENPIFQADSLERRAIRAKRHFVFGTARVIVPASSSKHRSSVRFDVEEVDSGHDDPDGSER